MVWPQSFRSAALQVVGGFSDVTLPYTPLRQSGAKAPTWLMRKCLKCCRATKSFERMINTQHTSPISNLYNGEVDCLKKREEKLEYSSHCQGNGKDGWPTPRHIQAFSLTSATKTVFVTAGT
eukprot:1138030-Pelagomonas_calceolata.AAC.1